MASSGSKAALAQNVWRLMFDFLTESSPERGRSLGRRGLTPNDARALNALDAGEGRSMRALADAWECDASNATWIVDRLERLGLAQRRSVEHDRRLKLVVLTGAGQKLKAELAREFYAPPEKLSKLDRDTLEALQRALQKLHSVPGESS
jgi:DNA-binding MarR family transcriptional regulator